MKLAREADMVAWCEAHGIPIEEVEGYYRRADIKELVMKGRWWQRRDGSTEKLSRYTRGGLIQYIAEYEGVGFDEAVQRILTDLYPGVTLPAPSIDRNRMRTSLQARIQQAKAGRKGGRGGA